MIKNEIVYTNTLKEAKNALDANKFGHLPLLYRIRLMQIVGDPITINKIYLECAKYVYPIWIADSKYDSAVLKMLETAESHLYKNLTDVVVLKKLADEFRNHIEEIGAPYGMAGMSAIALCYSIISNAEGILNIENYANQDDGDFDWDVWNPDFYASIAASGGNPFINAGNAEKRRKFWQWYIDILSQIYADTSQVVVELPNVKKEISIKQIIRSQNYNLPAITDKIKKVIELCINDFESANISSWDQIILTGECMKGGLAMKGRYKLNIDEYSFKLKYYLYKGDESSVNLMNQLKYAMYNQACEEGAWMQFKIVVEKDLSFASTFNYDDFDALPQNRKDVTGLEEEFKLFPRSKAFTPDWWQEIVDKKGLSYL